MADYESGQYYLYLHRHDKPEASSDEFENWTWQAFISTVLDPLITSAAPRYPQRTATQLHDLRDDLRTITNMTPEHTADQEKIDLYLDHVDAITEVSDAFDDAWTSYSEHWGSHLVDNLEQDPATDVRRQQDSEYPEVVVPRPETDDDHWHFLDTGGDWQHLHKYGWYRHAATGETLTSRASDSNDLRIGFYHRMEKHRDAAVRDHKLQFNFRNMGSNPGAFKDIYSETFDAATDSIEPLLTETNGSLTGNKLTKITATYDIPVGSADGFFDAYTTALAKAFDQFVIDNPELVALLSDTFEDALAEYNQW